MQSAFSFVFTHTRRRLWILIFRTDNVFICFQISLVGICGFRMCPSFISLHIRSMLETTVMHKQVSGCTVNFGPNFPESPFLESQTRKPPPPFRKTSDLGWPMFTPEYPPHFGKLQIWNDQSLLWNTPPHPPFGKLQIWDDQSLLQNTPPHFGKLQIWHDQSLLRNTPPPHFGKLQIWHDQSLLRNTPPTSPPPPEFKNAESYYMWRLYPTGITTRLLFKAVSLVRTSFLC